EETIMSTTISTEGLGVPVKISAIDGELKKLWEVDEASTNASLMNFLVYTEDPSKLAANSEIIQEFTRENACRAVLIAMDRKAPEPSVQAWITAHCHLAHGKKSICSEQISFLLSGYSFGRLRNTVFAHLNSDLPLVFWWQGEISDLFEERLYSILDRFIFDSSSWVDPAAGFGKILEAREQTSGHMVTQDLAWTRSYHYRLAIAGLFDDPAAERAFPEIKKVTIVAQKTQRTTALLLLAWIAEQAGWKSGLELGLAAETNPENGESFLFESKEGHNIVAKITWDDSGAPLSLLSIQSPDCEVKVSREKGNSHLCQAICTDGHCLYVSGPADSDESEGLVGDQLSRGGKNSLFLRVLPRFLELL
ncbi:glucose-6-phosphate dehydrogenase assembly protein OpcA, partial [Akkermansiaceae bacterium]|nr:glucose-6-phosphate dehydrogenase assembly protein OpcA [Akkermansiaceae bacterium]